MKMLTREQTTTIRQVGSHKETIGPIEDVPVHPLGEDAFGYENITREITTPDGTVYSWSTLIYVNEQKGYTAEPFNAVYRRKDNVITTWEYPPTIEQAKTLYKPQGMYIRFYPDGSVTFRDSKNETYYYGPINKPVEPIKGSHITIDHLKRVY